MSRRQAKKAAFAERQKRDRHISARRRVFIGFSARHHGKSWMWKMYQDMLKETELESTRQSVKESSKPIADQVWYEETVSYSADAFAYMVEGMKKVST